MIVIGLPTLLATVYFGLIAADQYVTEFKFTVRGPQQVPQPKDMMSSLTGMPGSGGLQTMQDAIIISEFINSRQGYQDVEQNMDVRGLFPIRAPILSPGSILPRRSSGSNATGRK